MIPHVLSAILAAAAVGAAAQSSNPVRWSVQKAPDTARAGQTIVIELAAKIDEGWHLYALEQSSDGPNPTTISVGPKPIFTLNENEIERPDPENDDSLGVETRYYKDAVVFGLPVTIASSVAAGQREIEVSARFQACTDKICLRPTTVTQKTTVKITSAQKK